MNKLDTNFKLCSGFLLHVLRKKFWVATGLVVIWVGVGEGMVELPLQRYAHTSGRIKSGDQLNVVYAEVSTPELSNVRLVG